MTAAKSRPYYVLFVRELGQWTQQFGDYSRATVAEERQDYRDHDCRASDLRIVRIKSDLQTDCDAVLAGMNSPMESAQ